MSELSVKKILILTYYWPPSGGSGVQRWMYFSKYLSDFGYEPIVITVDPSKASYRLQDKSFVDFVKNVRTIRTKSFEPLRIYSMLKTKSNSKTEGIPIGNVNAEKKSFFGKTATYIRGNFFIPDARIGWNKYALKKAKEIIKSEEIFAVVTTGPPHSTHLIGQKLKSEFELKWIADFRDPWSDLYYNKDLMRTRSSKMKDLKLEKQILEECDIVLTVGQKLLELLEGKLDVKTDKFRYIYNGFDAIKMNNIIKEEHSFFEITFIGILTENQPYRAIIDSILEFIKDKPKETIRLCLAGNIQKEIVEIINNELKDIDIEFHGYVSHEVSIGLMKRSKLLINCLADMEHNEILISGKHMEYIATGNPILSIGNKLGDAAILLNNFDNADTFDKYEIIEMSKFIENVYDKWKNNETFQNDTETAAIKSKSRYETTRQLAELLDQI